MSNQIVEDRLFQPLADLFAFSDAYHFDSIRYKALCNIVHRHVAFRSSQERFIAHRFHPTAQDSDRGMCLSGARWPLDNCQPLGHSIDDGIFLRIRGVRQGVRLDSSCHEIIFIHFTNYFRCQRYSLLALLLLLGGQFLLLDVTDACDVDVFQLIFCALLRLVIKEVFLVPHRQRIGFDLGLRFLVHFGQFGLLLALVVWA
mmetsp:Transcript_12298/g.27249  ORF Transcript_12298/g.27249 Transcript_12298/m.27249 type:complete len:201 (-) Transcript_12298:869-1471(-)